MVKVRMDVVKRIGVASVALSTLLGGCVMESDERTSSAALATASGTEYLAFWSGELRIHALEDNTSVTLIDIATGAPLAISDPRIASLNVASNPFVLSAAGDSFEGGGGRGNYSSEIQVRIESSKPVVVWTGELAASLVHPSSPPGNVGASGWASYIPSLDTNAVADSSELGKSFMGFTSRDMRIIALRDPSLTTSINIQDLATNTDGDTDDSVILGPGNAVLDNGVIQIFELTGFEDDTVSIQSNVDISVLVGYRIDQTVPTWSATPPSFAAGDNGSELGTLFYTFARQQVTVFPTEDNTTVTITDLSDGDDTTTFTLQHGDTIGDYSVYTSHTYSNSHGAIVPRNDAVLTLDLMSNNNPIDSDYLQIQADKKVLVYVGPVGSDVREMADVAFSVPTGPDSRIVYAFAQNSGGSNDLQIFGFDPDTEVTITSLSHTANFHNSGNHDFMIGPGIASGNPSNATADGPWLRGTAGADVWWGSGVWNAEMLRIESNKPITVINGDYDGYHFGAYLPFVLNAPTLPPTAVIEVSAPSNCPGSLVTFDGSASFDADTVVGDSAVQYIWDLDIAVDSDGDGDPANDVDALGAVVSTVYPGPGTYTAQLTFIDDDGESDTAYATVTVSNEGCSCPHTQGYWKNHPEDWPVTALLIGDALLDQAALLELFGTPVRGDASMNLVHQLMAAKLNVASGAAVTADTLQAIADADALLSGLVLPAGVRSNSPLGQDMVAVARALDQYNNGDLTPECLP